jgi:hypothetical protein
MGANRLHSHKPVNVTIAASAVVVLLGSVLVALPISIDRGKTGPARPAPAEGSPSALLSELPLDFIENRGQWDTQASFVMRKGSMAALFREKAIELQLAAEDRRASVGLVFEGASEKTALVGEQRRSGTYNFFMGRKPAQWHADVPAYASLLYKEVYDGIDVRVREGGNDNLEYDVLVDPTADVSQTVIRSDGISGLELASDGSLVLQTPSGPLRQEAPVAWEVLPDGDRRFIESRFRIIDDRRYGFSVAGRDGELPLVIDPGLDWATYLGGNGEEGVKGLARTSDGSGDVVVAGQTWSPDFPHTSGHHRPVGGTPYVARLNSSGSALVYSTFFGGSFNHSVQDVALNASDQPLVVGDTNSLDFPTTPGAYDRTPGDGFSGDYDAYAIQFDATGTRPVFGTYLGGSPGSANYEQAWQAGFSPSGAPIVAGYTTSADFPTTVGAYDRTIGRYTNADGTVSKHDVFVSRLDPTGSELTYSTFYGGEGSEWVYAMVVDSQGFVTLTGRTSQPQGTDVNGQPFWLGAPLPTTSDAFDSTYNGYSDGYVARLKLDAGGAEDLRYSSFLGGKDYTEAGTGIAVDPSDAESVTVSGWTRSADFPTTPGALLRVHNGKVDASMAFVARFRFPSAEAGSLQWSTFYGGNGGQSANEVVVDGGSNAIIAGGIGGGSPPTTERAFDRTPESSDGFVARISPDGDRLLYSTLLGGGQADTTTHIVHAGGSSVVVAGLTRSPDFPTTPGAFDRVYGADGRYSGGGASPGTFAEDVYLAKLTLQAPEAGDVTAPGAPALRGPPDGATFTAHTYVTLDWSDVSDESGIEAYHLQVSPNPDFRPDPGSVAGTFYEAWRPTSVDVVQRSISNTGTMYWRVQTLDGANNLGPWSAVRTFTVQSPTPPPAPVLVNPPNNGRFGPGDVTFAWNAAAGANFYELQVDTSSSFSNSSKIWVRGITKTQHTVSFTSEKRYYWRVRGTNDSTSAGAWSSVWNFEIKNGEPLAPAPPSTSTSPSPSGSATALKSMTPGQISLHGGTSGQLSVTLNGAAPPEGAVVELASQYPNRVAVPPSVTVPAGATSASFTATARSTDRPPEHTVVSGEYGGVTQGSLVTVFPNDPVTEINSLTLGSSSVTGGAPVQATVALIPGWKAGPGGALVTLASTDPATASVPSSVTIPQGANSATFSITTQAVTAAKDVTILAAHSVTLKKTLKVSAPPAPGTLASVSLSPTSVTGGGTSQGTVTLDSAAPPGGADVALSSSNTAAATVPASTTVPEGATSANFTVTTKSVTANTSATISATRGDVTKTAVLSVTAATSTTLSAPSLLSPANDARFSVGQTIVFDWSDVSGAASYTIQIDDSDTISSPFVVNQTVTRSTYSTSTLPARKLWWRVRANDAAGKAGAWSTKRRLEVR